MHLKTKSISIYIISLLLFFILFGCEQPNTPPGEEKSPLSAAERGLGDVALAISVDKKLNNNTDTQIKYWEFMATPQFILAPGEGEAVGQVKYWRQLSAIITPDGGKPILQTELGRYMGGDWFFELRALDKRGHVIDVGSTYVNIAAEMNNLVQITVYPDSADGTHGESADDSSRITGVTDKALGSKTTTRYGVLHMGIVSTVIDNLDDIKLTVKAQKFSRISGNINEEFEIPIDWTVKTDADKLSSWYENATSDDWEFTGEGQRFVPRGKALFEGSANIDAGVYRITITLSAKNDAGNWVELGGQGFNIVAIGGNESVVKGFLSAGSYSLAGIQISVPGTIYGTINGKGNVVSVNGDKVKLQWVQDQQSKDFSDEVPASFEWAFQNQILPENGESITVECPKDENDKPIYGAYRVSLCPIGSAGSKGHTDIDVIFNPFEQTNMDNYDWANNIRYKYVVRDLFDLEPNVTGGEIVIGFVEGNGQPIMWDRYTELIPYPYTGYAKEDKAVYNASDIGLSPVYVTTAAALQTVKAKNAWFGPTATLGETSSNRCPDLKEIRFSKNVTEIQPNACSYLPNLERILFHDGITQIGNRAFEGDVKLIELIIPNASVQNSSFKNCTGLNRVTFGQSASVTNGVNSFMRCTKLWSVQLPTQGDTTLAEGLFSGCTALKMLSVPDCFTTIGQKAFENAGIEEIDTNMIIDISAQAFINAKALAVVKMPNVETIGNSAFRNCIKLGRIELTEKLKSIEPDVFNGDTTLDAVNIPESLTKIQARTFMGCSNMVSINFAEGLVTIEESAFENCTGLNSLWLPQSLKTIGKNAFKNNTALIHVRMNKTGVTIDSTAFAGCTSLEHQI